MSNPAAALGSVEATLAGVNLAVLGFGEMRFYVRFICGSDEIDMPSFSRYDTLPDTYQFIVGPRKSTKYKAYLQAIYRGRNPLNVQYQATRLFWPRTAIPLKGGGHRIVFRTDNATLKIAGRSGKLRDWTSERISAWLADFLRIGLQKQSKNYKGIRKSMRTSTLVNPLVETRTWPTNSFKLQAGVVTDNTTGTYTGQSYKKDVITRAVTPGFFSKPKSELPVQPYEVVYIETEDAMGRERYDTQYFGTGGISYPHTDIAAWYGPTQWLYKFPWATEAQEAPGVDNKAIQRVIDKAGQDVNNVLQDVVQWHQVSDLVGSTTGRISRAYHAVRSKNFRRAIDELWNGNEPAFRKGGGVSRLNSLSRNWLELQYGWKPLLQDIAGLIHSIARLNERSNHPIITVRAGASGTAKGEWPVYGPLKFSSGGGKIGFVTSRRRTSIQYGLRYTIDDQTRAFLAQTGFLNPLDLAWEVIPFSFVADWFLPIGPYLESLTSFSGLKFIDGWKSSKTIEHLYTSLNNKTVTNIYSGPVKTETVTYQCHGFTVIRHCHFKRQRLTSFPQMDVPSFKNGLSVQHALNGIALIAQLFKGR